MSTGALNSTEQQCGQAGVGGLQGGWSLSMVGKPPRVQNLVLCYSQPGLQVFVVESLGLETLN